MKRSLLLAVALLLLLSAPAQALAAPLKAVTSYTVNNLLDPGSGTCLASACSLRAAIAAANTDGTASSITFSVTGIISLTEELPQITDTTGVTSIDAGSYWIDINGNDNVRLFSVATGAGLTLKNLILEHGYTLGYGGIIHNHGTLTIVKCSLMNSQAALGGAIYNDYDGNTLADISQSYVANNTATSQSGAIHQGNGSTTVTNSTFYNNTAPDGAVVTNATGWVVTIMNSTIAGNRATAAGGGSVHNGSGLFNLRNTIVANPAQGANCSGSIYNQGNNLDSGTSCGWGTALGSKSSTNPKLLPAGGSGPATSFGLQPSSPAVDGVTNVPTNCPSVDQRGVTRPIDGDRNGTALCDIGAVELQLQVFLPLVIR
jgi:hypothetical protein